MEIEFDPVKRAETLRDRGLDFRDAVLLFDGRERTFVDDRFDYGEERRLTYGRLGGIPVIVVWTERAGRRRIISMRRLHRKEIENVGLD